MLQSELVTRLQNFFENNIYYTSEDLNNSIQDGYDETVALSGCILKATSIPFTKNTTFYDMLNLIPDYIGVVAVFNATIRRWMWPLSMRKLDQVRIDWETAPGTPWYFIPVSHRYMAIYKKPNVDGYGNMFIYYVAAAPTLAPTDTIQIPDDYANALMDYCIMDLWEQNQEWEKAAVHFGVYREMMEELRVWSKNKRMSDRQLSLKG